MAAARHGEAMPAEGSAQVQASAAHSTRSSGPCALATVRVFTIACRASCRGGLLPHLSQGSAGAAAATPGAVHTPCSSQGCSCRSGTPTSGPACSSCPRACLPPLPRAATPPEHALRAGLPTCDALLGSAAVAGLWHALCNCV